MIKSWRTRWAGHGLRGKKRNVYKVLVEEPGGKNHLQELGKDGRIILKS
jgi:hypothetical protein